MTDFSKLTRPKHLMPDYIDLALRNADLLNAYQERPAYQQNDYIGWITRAKRTATRVKRLEQMLKELKLGTVYMKMKWNNPSKH